MKIVKWKQWCDRCKKNHVVSLQPCPDCGTHDTPQPISEKIKEQHSSSIYTCDGCDTYKEHLS